MRCKCTYVYHTSYMYRASKNTRQSIKYGYVTFCRGSASSTTLIHEYKILRHVQKLQPSFQFPATFTNPSTFFYCYTFLFLLLLKYDFERGGSDSSIAFRNHFLNNFVLKNTPFFIFFYPIHRHVPGSYYFSNRSFCNFFFQSFVFFISTLKRNSFEWTFYQLQNNPASRQCFSHALFFKRKKFAIFFVSTIIPPSPFNSADIFTSKSFAITRRSKIQFVKLEVKTAI